jgi:hypothetical protein
MSSTSRVGAGGNYIILFSPPVTQMKAGRMENVGTSWNGNRWQNRRKTRRSQDWSFILLPANSKARAGGGLENNSAFVKDQE